MIGRKGAGLGCAVMPNLIEGVWLSPVKGALKRE